MKFDRHKDPAACAAKDPTRYAVQGVAIVQKGDATFLAATDGHSLSLVRGYPEDDDDMPAILGQGRIYPPAAFVSARRAGKRKPDATVLLNGSAYVHADGATTEFARVDGTFPDVLSVLPTTKPVQTLHLNAEMLARLQKAMGANGVAIEVHALDTAGQVDASVPLTIRPLYLDGPGTDDGSFGVLMPIRGD
jgi:DNA polymerase III sliding clamp (beta) subunit (PCNA family)